MNEELIKMVLELQKRVGKLESMITYNPYKGYYTSMPTTTDLPNTGDYAIWDDSGTIKFVINVAGVLMQDKAETIAAI